MEVLLAVISFGLVNGMTPGPNNTLLMISGANFGFRATLPHLLGIITGFPLMVFLVAAGLGQLLTRLPWLHSGLKYVCAVWLLVLAYRLLRAGPPGKKAAEAAGPISFWNAAAFQWVNPKALIMAVTSSALFMPAGADALTGAGFVSLGFFIAAIPSAVTWCFMGAAIANFLNSDTRVQVFNIIMTLLLIVSVIPVFF